MSKEITVLIQGPSGVGKTRLAEILRRTLVDRGASVEVTDLGPTPHNPDEIHGLDKFDGSVKIEIKATRKGSN